MFKRISRGLGETLSIVPTIFVVLITMALFVMNILANKSLETNVEFIAVDAGILISWIVFLFLDLTTKIYGVKHANRISILSICISTFFCIIMLIASVIPGIWKDAFDQTSKDIINDAINSTIGGTWYVVLISAIAFVIASLVNNYINHIIGRLVKDKVKERTEYCMRSFISTTIAQFIDNFFFAFFVGHFFFEWKIIECLSCSLIGMLIELVVQIFFTPIGYRILTKINNKHKIVN